MYHISRLTTDISGTIRLIRDHDERSFSLETLARRLETEAARSLAATELHEAYELFRAAAMASSDERAPELSLRAAAAAIELGEFDDALRIAAEVESLDTDSETQERASVLGIRALWFRDGADSALERMKRLDPRSGVGLYQWYLMGDAPEDVRQRLEDGDEGSLFARVLSGEVGRPALPNTFLSGIIMPARGNDPDRPSGDAPDTSDSEVADLDADDTVAGLQLGSYQRREYAEAHSETVNDAGYSSRVETGEDGAHKVLIVFDGGRSRKEAEVKLLRLRDEGFEGFIRVSLD